MLRIDSFGEVVLPRAPLAVLPRLGEARVPASLTWQVVQNERTLLFPEAGAPAPSRPADSCAGSGLQSAPHRVFFAASSALR